MKYKYLWKLLIYDKSASNHISSGCSKTVNQTGKNQIRQHSYGSLYNYTSFYNYVPDLSFHDVVHNGVDSNFRETTLPSFPQGICFFTRTSFPYRIGGVVGWCDGVG